MRRFTIDPSIARASTLPGWVYRDPEIWAHLLEQVFPTTWQPIPGAVLEGEPGTVSPFQLGRSPLIASRDQLGRTRVLSNVCTHRGAIMVEASCQKSRIRCPYHGRSFHLDGRMAAAPHFAGAEDFPRPTDDLPTLSMASVGPLRFAAARPAAPLEKLLQSFTALWPYPSEAVFTRDPEGDRRFPLEASFALYCENYLEGFHVPFVHPGLNQALDPTRYRTEIGPGHVLQLGFGREGETTFELPEGHPLFGQGLAALYLWLFPNTMVNLYPWGISLNHVEATATTHCVVRYESWVTAPELRGQGAGSGLDEVEQEDQEVVRRVARGIQSILYDRGRYSPSQEQGVHHFHRMLAASLTEPGGWVRL